MGYVTKNIAVITEPKVFSLSNAPNFVQFERKPANKIHSYFTITVKIHQAMSHVSDMSLLQFVDSAGAVHSFRGTTEIEEAGGAVFYVGQDTTDNALNLCQALLSDKWFSERFSVVIPPIYLEEDPYNGDTLHIRSKGAGEDYNIELHAPGNAYNLAYILSPEGYASYNNDSISGEASTAEIALEIYDGINVGVEHLPTSYLTMGRRLTTLRKTYAGRPLWFELNSLFSQYGDYNIPQNVGWSNPGTLRAYRFAAKIEGANSFYFYFSNALFVLKGQGAVPEPLDLSPYVYSSAKIKLLTNKPRTPYIRGQKEYLNFIYSSATPSSWRTLRIAYRAYNSYQALLGTIYAHEQNHGRETAVKTCLLNIDSVLDQFPKTSVVKIALYRGGASRSNDLEYEILPEQLHALRQFSFINKLGGWDAFNFDAPVISEITPKVETYSKTVTPSTQKATESVYDTKLANSFTIEGAPVTDEVAEWLKELASASVILDGEGNPVIIEDFKLRTTEADKDMQRPIVKYRLAE